MKKDGVKNIRVFILIILIILLNISFINAGLIDWFKDLFGTTHDSSSSSNFGELSSLSGGEEINEDYILYYNFDRDISDISVNEIVGENHGGEIKTGIKKGSIYFSGKDYVHIPDNDLINLAGPYSSKTISFWFKDDLYLSNSGSNSYNNILIKTSNSNDYIISSDDYINPNKQVLYEEGGKSNGLIIYLENGEIYYGFWSTTSRTLKKSFIKTVYKPHKWNHVVLVLNNARENFENDKLIAYLNSKEVGKKRASLLLTHGNDIGIGGTVGGTRFKDFEMKISVGYFFRGYIDEFVLWNRPLTKSEIENIYENTLNYQEDDSNVKCKNDVGCISFGSFCEGDIPYTCEYLDKDDCLDKTLLNRCPPEMYCLKGECKKRRRYPHDRSDELSLKILDKLNDKAINGERFILQEGGIITEGTNFLLETSNGIELFKLTSLSIRCSEDQEGSEVCQTNIIIRNEITYKTFKYDFSKLDGGIEIKGYHYNIHIQKNPNLNFINIFSSDYPYPYDIYSLSYRSKYNGCIDLSSEVKLKIQEIINSGGVFKFNGIDDIYPGEYFVVPSGSTGIIFRYDGIEVQGGGIFNSKNVVKLYNVLKGLEYSGVEITDGEVSLVINDGNGDSYFLDLYIRKNEDGITHIVTYYPRAEIINYDCFTPEEKNLCGDGIVEINEECDSNKFIGGISECSEYNSLYNSGKLLCSDDCKILTTNCVQKEQCKLTYAYWSNKKSIESEPVQMIVKGKNCDGLTLIYDIFEDDTLSNDDKISLENNKAKFNGEAAILDWNSEFNCDGVLCGDPEYYFTGVLESNRFKKISSITNFENELKVSKCLDTCESLRYSCGYHHICGKEILCGEDCYFSELCNYDSGCSEGYSCSDLTGRCSFKNFEISKVGAYDLFTKEIIKGGYKLIKDNNNNIYIVDLINKNEFVYKAESNDIEDALIKDNHAFFSINDAGNHKIFLYDLYNKEEKTIVEDDNKLELLSSSGDYLIYKNYKKEYILININTKNKILLGKNLMPNIKIFGTKIVYSVSNDGLYYCDLLKNGNSGGCLENDERIKIESSRNDYNPETGIYTSNILMTDLYNDKLIYLKHITEEKLPVIKDSRELYFCDFRKNGNLGGCLENDEKIIVSYDYLDNIALIENYIILRNDSDLYGCNLENNGHPGGCLDQDSKVLITNKKNNNAEFSLSGDFLIWYSYNDHQFHIVNYKDYIKNSKDKIIVNSCRNIKGPGSYVLTVDLDKEIIKNTNFNDNCIIIDSDNVIFDCRGHNILGEDLKNIITSKFHKNITIKNCLISSLGNGGIAMNLNFLTKLKILNNEINQNNLIYTGVNTVGINLDDSNSIIIKNNDISMMNLGVNLLDSENIEFSGNSFCWNSQDLNIDNLDDFLINTPPNIFGEDNQIDKVFNNRDQSLPNLEYTSCKKQYSETINQCDKLDSSIIKQIKNIQDRGGSIILTEGDVVKPKQYFLLRDGKDVKVYYFKKFLSDKSIIIVDTKTSKEITIDFGGKIESKMFYGNTKYNIRIINPFLNFVSFISDNNDGYDTYYCDGYNYCFYSGKDDTSRYNKITSNLGIFNSVNCVSNNQIINTCDNCEFLGYECDGNNLKSTKKNCRKCSLNFCKSYFKTYAYEDNDGDGYGSSSKEHYIFEDDLKELGYVKDKTDCDDNNPQKYVMISAYKDNDGDGYGSGDLMEICTNGKLPLKYSLIDGDCDDNNPQKYVMISAYKDNDGDGYGSGDAESFCDNEYPEGYVKLGGDCDDNNGEVFLNVKGYYDKDLDGLGSGEEYLGCGISQEYYTLKNGDCDNNDPFIKSSIKIYEDNDGDGYGDPDKFLLIDNCQDGDFKIPQNYVKNGFDCDDQNKEIHPMAVESCKDDNIDQNCDGFINRNCEREIIGSKEVFLISDKDIPTIMNYVPVTTWTDINGNIHKNPMLIYSVEKIIEENQMYNQNSIKLEQKTYTQEFISKESKIEKITIYLDSLWYIKYRLSILDKNDNVIENSKIFESLGANNVQMSVNVFLNKDKLYKIKLEVLELTKPQICKEYPEYCSDPVLYYSKGKYPGYGSSLGGDKDLSFVIYYRSPNNNINNHIDIDSTIHFLEQYNPEKINIIAENFEKNCVDNVDNDFDGLVDLEDGDCKILSLLKNYKINVINPKTFLNNWNNIKTIVYVEKDYDFLPLASSFASLTNSPLIIKDSSLDDINECGSSPCVFDDKEVIVVGNINCPNTAKICKKITYNRLEKIYASATGTDKIIIINTDDLYNPDFSELLTEKTGDKFLFIHYKDSIASPILASGKHELILNVKSNDPNVLEKMIHNKINSLVFIPRFMTIVASNPSIPYAKSILFNTKDKKYTNVNTDLRYYSDIDGDYSPNIATGRILGITLTDTSTTIARSLFIKDIISSEFNTLFVLAGLDESYTKDKMLNYADSKFYQGKILDEINNFDSNELVAGFNEVKDSSIREYLKNLYSNVNFVIYDDHGGPSGFLNLISTSDFVNTHSYLNNLLVLDIACETCPPTKLSSIFCIQNLRRGAIGFEGTVRVTYWDKNKFRNLLEEFLVNKKTIGESIMIDTQKIYADDFNNWQMFNLDPEGYSPKEKSTGDLSYIYLGDPTIKYEDLRI